MDSGIYKITFYTGHFYIGKSDNIPGRWKNHQKAFEQRKHTKKMQALYDQCGEPQYEVVLQVHPDHVHIYETVLIHQLWGDKILNTTKPKPLSAADAQRYLELYDEVTFNGSSAMLFSTLQHLEAIKTTFQELQQANQRVEQLETAGVVLPHETEQQLQQLRETKYKYYSELQRLKHLSWWDRLLNYRVYV